MEAKCKSTTFASDLFFVLHRLTFNSEFMKKRTSKKYAILFSSILLLGGTTITATPIEFGVNIIDLKPGFPGSSKGPINTPWVDLDGHVLTFDEGHVAYALCILDAIDVIVYSAYVPPTQTTVNLPTTLSGEYQLRLIPNNGGSIYFYGFVLF